MIQKVGGGGRSYIHDINKTLFTRTIRTFGQIKVGWVEYAGLGEGVSRCGQGEGDDEGQCHRRRDRHRRSHRRGSGAAGGRAGRAPRHIVIRRERQDDDSGGKYPGLISTASYFLPPTTSTPMEKMKIFSRALSGYRRCPKRFKKKV